jgi:hypothetical protein
VKLLDQIKTKIQGYLLKRQIKQRSREAEFHNLETAKSIHLFFDAKSKENYLPVKTFISDLKARNIRIQAIGMTENEEQKALFLFHKEVRFICPKETNWIDKPPKETLEELNRQRADIFINLCTEACFAGQYTAAVSEAKFKVSGISNDPVSDFVIDVSKKKSISYLIDQTKHFLSTIQKA